MSLFKKIEEVNEKELKNIESIEEDKFFGRKEELSKIEKIFNQIKTKSYTIGFYGPRRSGKTFCIKYFINQKIKKLKEKNIPYINLEIVGDYNKNLMENVLEASNKCYFT